MNNKNGHMHMFVHEKVFILWAIAIDEKAALVAANSTISQGFKDFINELGEDL
jgi:hypothetical protein